MNKNEKEQSCCLLITLPLSGSHQPVRDMLSHGLLLATEAKKMGGRARCLRSADAVIMVASGVSREQIEPLIDCMSHSPCMKAVTLKVIVEERDTIGIDLESEGVIPGEFAREPLTKKFLFELPHGAIVVGNCCSSKGRPYFAARLDAGMDRSRIWRRAVNSHDARRICNVYWDEQDVSKFHGYSLDSLMDDNDESPLPMFRM